MQKYTEIDENKTLRESRELLLNNDKTAISCNSGPAFPTINLQPGMLCFRTDEQKLYQLNANGETWIELFDLSGNKGLVSKATTADNALKVNGHTVNANVPVNAKFTDTTYGTVTDSASGLMTAAQKKKLDDLANYSLPVASATTLGGVKIGDGLTITNGILSSGVTGGNATHGEKLFTANNNFIVPEGVSILVVTAVGGGGGGGAGGGEDYNHVGMPGGAGGRGSVTSSIPVPVTPGESIPVIVGQGGVGGGYPHIAGSGGAGDPSGANGTANDRNSNYWGGRGGAGGSKYNSLGGAGGATGNTTNSSNTNAGGGGGGGGASSFKAFVYASGGGGGAGACTAHEQATGGRGGNAASILYDYKVSTSYGAGGGAGPKGSKGGNGSTGCVYIRW